MNLELFGDVGSNSTHRIQWVLNYKKVPYIFTNYQSRPLEEYKEINPFNRVPTLLIDGAPLTESMAIAEFLEEIFPELPLLPISSYERAKVREICEIVNSTIHPIQNSQVASFFIAELSKEETKAFRRKWIEANLPKVLPFLFQKGHFAYGESFGLADIFIASIVKKGLELGIDASDFRDFENHLKFCLADQAIAGSCPFYRQI